MPTTTLRIEGLGATAATGHIEKALEAVPSVDAVELDSASGTAIVEHHGADHQLLLQALRSVGYDQASVA